MKKLLFLLLLTSIVVSAQTTHYDSSVSKSFVYIQPIKVQFNDTAITTRLYIEGSNDNYTNSCPLYYVMRSDYGTVTLTGNATISGSDYQNWNGSNTYPFTWLVGLLKLTPID